MVDNRPKLSDTPAIPADKRKDPQTVIHPTLCDACVAGDCWDCTALPEAKAVIEDRWRPKVVCCHPCILEHVEAPPRPKGELARR